MRKIIIALGGNAILKKGEKPIFETQERNIKKAIRKLFPLIKKNKVVVTHGNGPQIGYLLIKQKVALDVLDAETEGQIGYLIQQRIKNIFSNNKIRKDVVTLLTQVLVDRRDEAFKNPTKFVGPFYTKKEFMKLKRKFTIKEDFGRGYRRVVASPKPIEIIESKVIGDLLRRKAIVIAVGGGGIPVVKRGVELDGIGAVIDKDLASACLGNSINADELIMITDVPYVYLDYKRKEEKKLEYVSLDEIKRYYKEGHFPAGNMGPKIEATINFLEYRKKRKVIITDINNIGKRGTIIKR
jgi:carbamate kinase